MDFAAALVTKALSQVGVTEATGANDGIPSLRYMNGRKEPWCGHFVAWVFREIGYPLPLDHHSPNGNPLASVTFMQTMFQDKLATLEAGVTPEPGDVLFLKSRGRSDAQARRHTGIVVAVHKHIGTFTTVEGNIPDKVGKVVYSVKNKSISGFGRVPDPESLRNPAAQPP